MSKVTNTDPVVTESKLTEFYEDIKPFLGCPAYLTSEGNSEYYSTEEKVIGRWADGKPIYQKTFLFSSLITISNTAWTPLPIKISDINLDIILDYKIGLNGGSSSTHNAIYSCNLTAEIPNSQYIQALAGRDGSSIYADYLVLQYTKTTDSAATTIQSDPNEYSTDEKIIGKWIDGKPIYQKTIDCGAAPNGSTNKEIAHGISNLGTTIKIEGVGIIPGNDWIYPVPFSSPTDLSAGITVWANSTYIVLQSRQNRTNSNIHITMQYTKTTD